MFLLSHYFFSNLGIFFLTIQEKGWELTLFLSTTFSRCAFHFVECILLYFQNGLGFFNYILQPIQGSVGTFWVPKFWIKIICAWANCELLTIIYKFLDIIWIWNINWGYILINEVGKWFVHVTFPKNCILVYKLYTGFLPNLLRPNVNFIAGVKVDISSKKLRTRKYF